MNIDNQTDYWNRVAGSKTFTHTVNFHLFEKFVSQDSRILDFGCGYGRIVKQLYNLGFTNIVGFDTSQELISRGRKESGLPIYHIDEPAVLPVKNNSIDCILLFAVLTCIPSNKGQGELINLLYTKLRKGGILCISDYYLQPHSDEVKQYQYLDGDEKNFGVFTLEEGVTFRHHTREWITKLTQDFMVISENKTEVTTMNGSHADAFQLFLQK